MLIKGFEKQFYQKAKESKASMIRKAIINNHRLNNVSLRNAVYNLKINKNYLTWATKTEINKALKQLEGRINQCAI